VYCTETTKGKENLDGRKETRVRKVGRVEKGEKRKKLKLKNKGNKRKVTKIERNKEFS
jgi:hypothetical protein